MFTKKRNTLDGVSIYIDDSQLLYYYAESYYLYKNHLNYLVQKINKYKSYKTNSKREEYFHLLSDAYTQNANNINEIIVNLKTKVNIDAYETLKINATDNTQTTLKDFIYLKRDWSFSQEGEKQLSITNTTIKDELSKIKIQNNNALFLGCGVGRIAFDFTDIYNKVYATDKSFSMIWHLQKLLNGDEISFYNPHEKNVHKLENVAKKYKAKISNKKLNNINGKFETFVSDVLDIPFNSESINAIFSIYFTDVIALKLWFNQINNVLSDDGIFVHFGPLDYFFSDEREMLTAQEFRLFFENNGYITLVDKIVETPHLEDSNSISYKVYRNWFFIAQKSLTKPEELKINDDTVLAIKRPIPYERKGILKEGEEELEVNLELPNGTFNGASSVVQILKFVDGKNTYSEILSELQKKGFNTGNSKEIKSLFLDFLNQGVLSIEN